MPNINELAKMLDALGHPLRLRIVSLLAGGEMYLNEMANKLEVSRALTKIHLIKLERANIVKSRIVVLEKEARALRYYQLVDFDLHISPKTLAKEVEKT